MESAQQVNGQHENSGNRECTKDLRPGMLAMVYPDDRLGRRIGSGTDKMSRMCSFAYLAGPAPMPDADTAYNKVCSDGRGFLMGEDTKERYDSLKLYDPVAASGMMQMLQAQSEHQVLLIPEFGYCFPRDGKDSQATTAFRASPFLMWTDVYYKDDGSGLQAEDPWLSHDPSENGRKKNGANALYTREMPTRDKSTEGRIKVQSNDKAFTVTENYDTTDSTVFKYGADFEIGQQGQPPKVSSPCELARVKQLYKDVYGEDTDLMQLATTGAPLGNDGSIKVRGGLLTNREGGIGKFVPDGVVLYKYSTQGDDEKAEAELDDQQNGVFNMVISGHALFTNWSIEPRPHPDVTTARATGFSPYSHMRRLVTLPRDIIYVVVTGVVGECVDLGTSKDTPNTPTGTEFGKNAVPSKGTIVADGDVTAQMNKVLDGLKTGGSADENFKHAYNRVVRRVMSIRYQRTTSRELSEMCHKRCGRDFASFLGKREVILGAWRIGSVVDSAASRPVLPSSTPGYPRTSSLPEMQGITISTGIRWCSSFELHDQFWRPVKYTSDGKFEKPILSPDPHMPSPAASPPPAAASGSATSS
tara:strand:+ start:1042 stop:2799 length:1758 start_codon:yes stop_codon:yes gene_type:complete